MTTQLSDPGFASPTDFRAPSVTTGQATASNGAAEFTLDQSQRRTMPVQVAMLDLSDVADGLYAGWQATVQLNVPFTVMTALENAKDEQSMYQAILLIVRRWNFVNYQGEPIPVSIEGLSQVPAVLVAAILLKFAQAFQEATALSKLLPTNSTPTS